MRLSLDQRPVLASGPGSERRVRSVGDARLPTRIGLEAQRLASARAPDPAPFSRPVRDLLTAIHASACDPTLSVQALKFRCRLRDNNISSRFRHEVGVPLKQYIDDLRLDIACELLRTGWASVTDAADAVGYVYVQTFYRAFKRRFGRLPGSLCLGRMAASQSNGGAASPPSAATFRLNQVTDPSG
jgi:AraC-like DNA-binding protein